MNKYIDAERLIHDLEERIYAYSEEYADGDNYRKDAIETLLKDVRYQCSLQQEQPEIDLKKFTEKMDAWKARYNYPDNISIKATMAFTTRMFYQYPNIARQWYDSLSKATMD